LQIVRGKQGADLEDEKSGKQQPPWPSDLGYEAEEEIQVIGGCHGG